jgi:hypothetical protein
MLAFDSPPFSFWLDVKPITLAASIAMNTKIANYGIAPHGNNMACFASSETKIGVVDLFHDPYAIRRPV